MAGIESIDGTFTLRDGRKHQFSITPEGSFQWGAGTDQLGDTVDILQAMETALAQESAFYTDPDEDIEDDDDDEEEDDDE